MATKTELKVYLLGLQEMKNYTCSRCHLNPTYKVSYFDVDGIRRAEYYCKGHYGDFIAEENKPEQPNGCEWCGSTDVHYHDVERFGETTGKTYKVCTPCKDRQEAEISEQFAEDDLDEGEDPMDLYRDLNNDDE